MRKIYRLTGAPKSFIRWKEANKQKIEAMVNSENHTGNTIWSFFRNFEKVYKELKSTLVQDQGYICCYCGQRIFSDIHTSIEHVEPKESEKKLTLDFDNLLASCDGGSNHRCHLVKKGETLISIADLYGVDVEHLEEVYIKIDEIEVFRKKYDIENLSAGDRIVIFPKSAKNEQHCDIRKGKKTIDIHPLLDGCSSFFRYSETDGLIVVTEANRKTVECLGLNDNPLLNRLREKSLIKADSIKRQLITDFGSSPSQFRLNRERVISKFEKVQKAGDKLDSFAFVILWSLKK
ncbi:MAG: hypothetical protein H6557_00255 [Lewinellaceae bacterium]|nr:hypothetical protein [Phaeodactylibacter sp.]MCB9035031.1 hypothetical protein [Lewinellaceae bacterium]